ncbi:MAG: hypothetical protein FWE06_02050, partial [Oscillospiraceae bacterium]|nr:hypothetical protein [Oscillospiraceae bacterium]
FGFGPDYTFTCAQAAVGLARMMSVLNYTTTGFPPVSQFDDWHIGGGQGGIPSWARDAVSFLYYHGIMGNTSSFENIPVYGYIFSPNLDFHTQQLITGMVRMLEDVTFVAPPAWQGGAWMVAENRGMDLVGTWIPQNPTAGEALTINADGTWINGGSWLVQSGTWYSTSYGWLALQHASTDMIEYFYFARNDDVMFMTRMLPGAGQWRLFDRSLVS